MRRLFGSSVDVLIVLSAVIVLILGLSFIASLLIDARAKPIAQARAQAQLECDIRLAEIYESAQNLVRAIDNKLYEIEEVLSEGFDPMFVDIIWEINMLSSNLEVELNKPRH